MDNPLQEGINLVDDGDSTNIKRRILVEEFTGHYCTNCPQGAAEVKRLLEVYGSQIVPVSIHSDPSFANPHVNGNGDPVHFIGGVAAYSTDFRTTEGDLYYNTFGVSGIPKALISRTNNGEASSLGQWETNILAILNDEAKAEINIETSYNTSSKQVTINVETEWLLDGGSDTYRIQVYIVEDHVTDWQLNAGVDIPDYDHRHVLRAVVNSAWGDPLNNPSSAGNKETKSYSYTLANGWNEDNCEVVAFVYKESPNYEVIQANIEHVK